MGECPGAGVIYRGFAGDDTEGDFRDFPAIRRWALGAPAAPGLTTPQPRGTLGPVDTESASQPSDRPPGTRRPEDRWADRVVVGYDGTRDDEDAIAWAARVAQTRGRPLLLLTAALPAAVSHDGASIFDTGVVESAAEFLRTELSRRSRELREAHPDLVVEAQYQTAGPAQVLIEASASAELVVLGRRARPAHGIAGLIGSLGSVADAVATHARGPVAVVPDGTHEPRTGLVLVGLESRATSYRVLEVAAQWARDHGRELLLLHAWDVAGPWRPEHLADAERVREVNAAWEAAMADEVQRLRTEFPGLSVRTELATGTAVDALVSRSAGASLIVVGTRGLGGFAGLLLGSTSRRVLQTAACPVIVVPGPDAPDDAAM